MYFYESLSNDEDSWVQEVGKKSGYYTEDPDEACLFVVSGTETSLKVREFTDWLILLFFH